MENGGSQMLEVYNKLFESYLRVCKSDFNPDKPYENLEQCCHDSERFQYELLGMITLMDEMKVITHEQNQAEWNRIIKAFSTHDLFNCFKESDGSIMVWCKR